MPYPTVPSTVLDRRRSRAGPLRRLATGAAVVLLGAPAHAELGDYDFLTALLNFATPFGPDHPVTPDQRTGPYPLLSNPPGFEDGWSPGNWLGWETIELHPDTGAVCGNGSPYKFFVNRTPNTSNMLIYMEGGGACWDYETCTGGSRLGARNPDGIPDDYLDIANPESALVSPFVFRLNPFTRIKTQLWNIVYLPYCTGDLYAGDRVALYDSEDGSDSIVWHHNGLRNVRAVLAWLKDNLPRPGQAMFTGCSAGGGGTLANYAHLREDLGPNRSFMLNDSGPIYPAPQDGDTGIYPSVPLQGFIREAWGLDTGPVQELERRLPAFDPSDMGTINGAVAQRFPEDRLGHTHFLADLVYSRYSYEPYYEELDGAPEDVVNQGLWQRWFIDTVNLVNAVTPYDNYGIYLPFLRRLNDSHCTTIVEFANSDIQEFGVELDVYVQNILEGTGPVIQLFESDPSADIAKPPNPLYELIDGGL